jgi:hypothetical protein
VSLSPPSDGTVHVFGRVNDQKLAHIFLRDLAAVFSQEVTKKGFLISENDLPLLESLFHGKLENLENIKTDRPLNWLKRFFSIEDKSAQADKLYKLKELQVPGSLETLLNRNGILFAQGLGDWQAYPVVHGRTEEPLHIKLSPEEWVKTPSARPIVQKLLKFEGLPYKPVTKHDEGVVSAVIWALSTSQGRTRDVIRFFPIAELRDVID